MHDGTNQSVIEHGHTPWRFLVGFVLVTRVALFLVALAATRPERPDFVTHPPDLLAGERNATVEILDELESPSRRWVAPWYRWDANWYAEISRSGYQTREGRQSSVAFLPLLPTLMAGANAIGLDRYWIGWLVPNLATVAGAIAVYQLSRQQTQCPKSAIRSAILLVSWPSAFFLAAPYHESLFLALVGWGLVAIQASRWGWASLLLGAAGLTKLTIVAVVAALVVDWFVRRVQRKSAPGIELAPALVAGGVFFALLLYFAQITGDNVGSFSVQQFWGRKPASLANLATVFWTPISGWGPLESWFDYLSMLVFLTLGFLSGRRYGLVWGLIIVLPILQAMSTGAVLSMGRLALSSFCAFIYLGERLSNRLLFTLVVAVSLLGQLDLLKQFVRWHFVG